MANETIKIKVETDAKDSIRTLGSLEDQLEDLKKEIKGVEVGSKAFKELSKQIIVAENEVKNLNKSFEGLDSEALTGEVGKLAGGVTSAMSGIAVLGDDANESMEAMIATVGKGMAVANGIKGATEAWSAAQKLLNFIMAANPVGLLVAAIGLLIGGIVALVSNGDKVISMLVGWGEKFTILQGPINLIKAGIQGLMDIWENAKRVFLGDDAVDKAIEEKADKIANEQAISTYEMLLKRKQAEKASAEEIYAIKKKLLEEKMLLLDKESDNYKDLKSELIGLEKEHTDKVNAEAAKVNAEAAKIYEENKKRKEKEAKEEKDRLDGKAKEEADAQKVIDDTKTKSDEEAKKTKEKAAKEELKRLQDFRKRKKESEDGWRLEDAEGEQEEYETKIELETERYELELENSLITNEEREFLKSEHLRNLQKLQEEHDKKDKIATKKKADYKKTVNKQEEESDKAKVSFLKSQLDVGMGLLKKDSIAYKSIASAKALVSTYQAAQTAYAGGVATIPVPAPAGIALGVALAGLAIVSGLANVAAINNVKFEQGGILAGNSHLAGGIQTPYGELEGGEGVVNKLAMSNPSLRNMASAANVGGKDFSTGDGSIKLSPESIEMIVGGYNDKQVYVSENDITETQNRVSVIENESIL
jgi:hypothetical protein